MLPAKAGSSTFSLLLQHVFPCPFFSYSLKRAHTPFVKDVEMPRSFIKMHGLGNDFVIIDGRKDNFLPDKAFCLALADRHRGVGYDQLIVLAEPKNAKSNLYMHIYNCDGSLAGACGNATRCVARVYFEETGHMHGIIETTAGFLEITKQDNDIYTADMGPARLDWKSIPLAEEMDTTQVALGVDEIGSACCVNIGNPHAVIFVSDITAIDLQAIGPKLEHHPLFPERCNIEFAEIIDPSHIRMRVWERGTGITQACGSGACATLVAAVRRGLCQRKATIHLDGGNLEIYWREEDNHVILSGTASKSFDGQLYDELFSKNKD